MTITLTSRRTLLTIALTFSTFVAAVAPASAQFKPRAVKETTMGERFHVEGSAAWWFPSADLVVSSGGTGALTGLNGSQINAKTDLGMADKGLPQLGLVLRPARKHKFRLQYIPINFEQTTTLSRAVDFNGQRYQVGLPVNSSLKWQALRLSYEYDFLNKDRWFGGFIIEDKQTDVRVDLVTPLIPPQFAHASAPIPALGGIGRFYATPQLSITGEVTGFKLPSSVDGRYQAHYVDIDIYGVYNATANVGIQGGFRSMDLGYVFKTDAGTFTLRGIYVGIVARY
jgi:hypothetical protein